MSTSDAVFVAAVGTVCLTSVLWWTPRRMENIRRRERERGHEEQFNAALDRPAYRYAQYLVGIVGLALLVWGIVVLVS